MPDHRFRLIVVLQAMALAWVLPLSAQDDPPPQPAFPTLPVDAPAGSGMMQPCMEELEGEVRCGRYRVWEDREARSGRTIDLAFVVAEALGPDADESSAATYFFGGPGTSVTRPSPFVIQNARQIRMSRDLLFLDFRGVGNSGALDCGVPYPGGIESRFGAIFPVDHATACRDELSERARLDLYTTDHNMDDLDELRGWLNYRTLDLNGGSYGAREIQIFLRRHPDSARTVVLNAASAIFERGYVSHAKGLQKALDELIGECARSEQCSTPYPDLGATVEKVLERVRTDPPEVLADGKPVRFGPGELGYALRGLLYRRANEVPKFVYAAADGDWQPLADYYVQRSGWVSDPEGEAGMHFSVLCAEDISQTDAATIERETAGTFLGDYLIGGYASVCEIWPYAKLDPSWWEPVSSDVPALLLSGTRDPVTPPSGADKVASHLTNNRHIVVTGGHGIGGPCIGSIVFQFVETGSVDDLDTSCLEEMPPTEFVVAEPGD